MVCIAVDTKATIAASLVAQLFRISYLRKHPWQTEPWKGLIERNSPGHAPIAAPILITQGEQDKLVTPLITSAFVASLCRRRDDVQYHIYPGVDHVHAGPRNRTSRRQGDRAPLHGDTGYDTCR